MTQFLPIQRIRHPISLREADWQMRIIRARLVFRDVDYAENSLM